MGEENAKLGKFGEFFRGIIPAILPNKNRKGVFGFYGLLAVVFLCVVAHADGKAGLDAVVWIVGAVCVGNVGEHAFKKAEPAQ